MKLFYLISLFLYLTQIVYANDLENNNISIIVNGNTNVINSNSPFKVVESEINGRYIEMEYGNFGLGNKSIVNSVFVECNTISSCPNGKTMHINTQSNVNLIGEGVINSIIIGR
jgi:hypothetical protein